MCRSGRNAIADVEKPIVATFTGKESLEPTDSPVDPPANFTFKAGAEPGDKGTINLKQTSNRGIATTTLEFEVQPAELFVTITGHLVQPGANPRLSTGEQKLEQSDRGFEGAVTGDVSGTVDALGCSTGATDVIGFRVIAVVDEADPDLVRLFVAPTTFNDKEQEITCQGATMRAFIPSIDFTLPFLGSDGSVTVRVGEATTLEADGVSATVTVRREETPS